MNLGIKKRLVYSYLLLICVTILLFETFLFVTVRYYFYDTIRNSFINQGIIFSNFYSEFLRTNSLEFNAEQMIEEYSFITEAEVQITDKDGNFLTESTSNLLRNGQTYLDINAALVGKVTSWRGNLQHSHEPVLAVSYPLFSDGEVVGVIRFVTSLVAVNEQLKVILLYLIGVRIFVIGIALFISYFLANTITQPIKKMNETAMKLAKGNFSVRIQKSKNDELGELADTLNFMASEVEKHDKLKNEFIASISHELRTPLTSLKGWAITLHAMTEDKLFREGLDIITSETERLTILVHDLLDFSALSSGRIMMRKEEVDMIELTQHVCQQMRTRAQRQQIELTCECSLQILMIVADRNRLKQVLINLIDNALKFTTEHGKIAVVVEKSNPFVQISISDTGKGISQDDLDLITGKFYKSNPTSGGMGLGLAICKEIIDAHHGRMQIHSSLNAGTTVTINL